MKNIKYLSKKSCHIGENVLFGDNIIIYPAVVIEKNIKIGNNTLIQTGVIIENNVEIGNNVQIQSGTIIKDNVKIGANVLIGPNSLIRNNTTIDSKTIIGPGCEIKNSKIGNNVLIGHKNFIGDAEIESDVQIGFGAVTANYSNEKYNQTKICSKAKIGCNVILIAPVIIGKNSIIGASSVVTENISDNSKLIQKKASTITKLS